MNEQERDRNKTTSAFAGVLYRRLNNFEWRYFLNENLDDSQKTFTPAQHHKIICHIFMLCFKCPKNRFKIPILAEVPEFCFCRKMDRTVRLRSLWIRASVNLMHLQTKMNSKQYQKADNLDLRIFLMKRGKIENYFKLIK